MANYQKIVSFIIENIGGKENIEDVTHCLTRLRFKLKDDSKVHDDKLSASKEVVTTQFAGGKYQVVIGTHVGDVYEEVIRQLGSVNRSGMEEKEAGSLIDKFTSTVTQIVTPILGVLGGCALILGLSSLLVAVGVLHEGDGAQIILNAIGNACLTFFPVLLGYTSAKAFKMDPFIGMVIGAVMIFPNITETINAGEALYTLFANSAFAMPVYKTFFGIPILFPSTGYASTMIPIVMANYFASKVQSGLNKSLPSTGKYIFLPFLTILISSVSSLLLIGPISIVLTNAISFGISSLMSISPILAFVVITLIYQPLVVFGLHWALISIGIVEFFTNGNSLIVASLFPASFAHLAVCLAVYLKSKNEKTKTIALPAVISACFCIIEPSIYGITLSIKKRFGICMIAGMIGGVILGVANAPMYAVTMGVTGFVGFINPTTGNISGMITCLIAIAVTLVTAFALTWFTYKSSDEGEEKKPATPVSHKKQIILSPMKGLTKELSEMSDKAFANGGLGKGVCIIPTEGKVVAPCDGTLSLVFPTGHAVGVTSDDGAEVLIHVGLNTALLPEGTFQKKKQQGDRVKKGEVLLTFDLEKLIKEGCNLETAVIVSNSNDYLDVVAVCGKTIDYANELFVTVVSELADRKNIQNA